MGEDLDSGWVALAQPTIRRQFDRHLENVVEAVAERERGLDRAVPASQLVLLASHAYDVRAGALREGWRAPRTAAEWTPDEWYGLRLLACYELASREPGGPKRPRRHGDWSSIVGLIRGSRPC